MCLCRISSKNSVSISKPDFSCPHHSRHKKASLFALAADGSWRTCPVQTLAGTPWKAPSYSVLSNCWLSHNSTWANKYAPLGSPRHYFFCLCLNWLTVIEFRNQAEHKTRHLPLFIQTAPRTGRLSSFSSGPWDAQEGREPKAGERQTFHGTSELFRNHCSA